MTTPTKEMAEAALNSLVGCAADERIEDACYLYEPNVRRYIAALEAENEKLKAAQQWRPIASAPKDGTVFDVWTKYGRVSDCVRCPQWGRVYALNPEDGYHNRPVNNATHWMLPPKPPKEGV